MRGRCLGVKGKEKGRRGKGKASVEGKVEEEKVKERGSTTSFFCWLVFIQNTGCIAMLSLGNND